MRFTLIILTMLLMFSSSALCTTDASFERFIKSREVVETVFFTTNAETLTKSERERLDKIVNKIRKLQKNGRMIRIEGYSSPEGDQERNFRLSFFRAKTVADFIQDKGLPAEVTLTGYGDLQAGDKELAKERRVEIVSYAKPGGMRRIQLAEDDSKKGAASIPTRDRAVKRKKIINIDSYRIDQAIRSRVDDRNKGLAEDAIEKSIVPDLSRFDDNLDADLERGYTLWRKSVDPEYAVRVASASTREPVVGGTSRSLSKVKPISVPGREPTFSKVKPIAVPGSLQRGYSQAEAVKPEELQRGYSQAEAVKPEELQRGYSQAEAVKPEELQRGYSQAEAAEAEELQRGYSQAEAAEAEELQRGYSQAEAAKAEELQRGYSQAEAAKAEELQRGYSQAEAAKAEELQRGYSQAEAAEAEELQRGYSQADPESLPGVTQTMPPAIDALMIEQAIMEKIGMVDVIPSASVSQVSVDFQSNDSSN